MSSLVIVNTLRIAICYLYNLKKLLHYLMGSSWLSLVGQRSQLLCPTCRWENCGSEGSDSLPKGAQMLNSGREFCSPDFALRDFYLEETKEEKRYFFFFFLKWYIEEEHPGLKSTHTHGRRTLVWLWSAFEKQLDVLHWGDLVLLVGPCGRW